VNSFSLFTDVSLDPWRKRGVGAYLVVPASFMEVPPHSIGRSAVTGRLVLRRFEDTSSTRLEVQTVLSALEDFRNELKAAAPVKLKVYSDSQCVAGLLGRRQGLEAGRFISKGKNRRITNASLYRKFYEFHDELGFAVIKVAGHSRSRSHDTVHRIFSCVDREVRQALNLWIG
jgi:ribonuclease HI